jgi:predicted MPP superfamily phosphohydrolase
MGVTSDLAWRACVLVGWPAAALSCWLLLVNRWLIHWVDGPLKSAATVATFVVLSCGAAWAAWRGPTWLHFWPCVMLALVGIGEIHRLYLRYTCQAGMAVRADHVRETERRLITTTDLVRQTYEIPVATLGTGRLRVAHVSDLHVDSQLPFDHYVSALALATADEPDLLLMTGDFVSKRRSLPLLSELLRGRLRARLGVFAVLGNHDYWTEPEGVRQILAQEGARLVAGRSERVELGDGTSVQICGTEHPWGPRPECVDGRDSLFTIVLSHTPDNIYDLSQLGAAAVFAGHCHGGQLRLPGLGALVVPSRYGRRFDRGHFQIESTHLFVSAGVGAAAPPLRLWCRPDVVVVDFVPVRRLGSENEPDMLRED